VEPEDTVGGVGEGDRWGRVDLVIRSSEMTPDELADVVGLSPDHSWWKGEAHRHTGRIEEASGVAFGSGLPEDAHPQEQLGALIDRLEPHRERIAALTQRLNLESDWVGKRVCLHFAHTPTGAMPGYFYDVTVISFLSAIGASLAVSLYITTDTVERD
jgi:hypothetical protein